ncbi:MAG: hypothetical protein JO325_23225 [Solirubrobacterales bacterium]|nr:hypothetical protein [Solirubrobacterales bacterium]
MYCESVFGITGWGAEFARTPGLPGFRGGCARRSHVMTRKRGAGTSLTLELSLSPDRAPIAG